MMRRMMYALLLLAAPSAMAQVAAAYRPFVEEGKEWKSGLFVGPVSVAYTFEYYTFEGDTLIDGERYRRWMCRTVGKDGQETAYLGAVREQDQRVHIVPPGQEKSFLLYDFAAPVGAELEVYGVQYPGTYRCVVAQKSLREEGDGRVFRTVEVRFHGEESAHGGSHQWIEGLGAWGQPTHNVPSPPGYYWGLFACKVGGDTLYETSHLTDGIAPRCAASPLPRRCYDLSGRPVEGLLSRGLHIVREPGRPARLEVGK